MKRWFIASLILSSLIACQDKTEISSTDPINWEARTTDMEPEDSLIHGTTYLSVYSQIYSQTEHTTHDLTATVSMKNTNMHDTVFVKMAEYFNTEGHPIRIYFDDPIFIRPMETVEIIIDETDQEGGTGANFLFTWAIKPNTSEPLFEAVMISTSGQQGLSFTTQGKRITPGIE
ncbi:MAG: DUF3124 domain-containing protein [Bacteroidales bacterium]